MLTTVDFCGSCRWATPHGEGPLGGDSSRPNEYEQQGGNNPKQFSNQNKCQQHVCTRIILASHHFWNYNIDVSFQLFSSKRPIKIFESCDGPHPPLGWGTASWLWKPSEPVETVIRVVAASTDFSARPNYNGPSGLFVIYKIEREPRVYGWMDGWGYKKCNWMFFIFFGCEELV